MNRAKFPNRILLFILFSWLGLNTWTPQAVAEWVKRPIGRDADGTVLNALVPENSNAEADKVLVIGGVEWLSSLAPDAFADVVDLYAIDFPLQGHVFPPNGTAYNKGDIAALYLWRWIGAEGFHTVFVVGADGKNLQRALMNNPVGKVGPISCIQVPKAADVAKTLKSKRLDQPTPDSAAAQIRARRNRTPTEVATALCQHYGKNLRTIEYIPALAVIGRQRLGELTGNPEYNQQANAAIEPWLARNHTLADGKIPGASTVAGYLVFVDAFERTQGPRLREIILEIASIGIDRKTDKPVQIVPNHSQMSDSVFMDPPLLAAAGRLTGDDRYYIACLNHIRSMQKMCLREDGIYRHSPLDEAAWGRGNGFPALGLALVLGELPTDLAGRSEVLKSFQDHIAALVKYQDATGMWHQVVDRPESYREFTSTCMITFAMLRGMRMGWLDPDDYQEPAARGWEAIKSRIGMNGLDLTDVCTGTGKQKNLEAYFHRTAILGRDDRGGAMALMVATERAFWEREMANGK